MASEEAKSKNVIRNKKCLEEGICDRCHKRPRKPGQTKCWACSGYLTRYNREWHLKVRKLRRILGKKKSGV